MKGEIHGLISREQAWRMWRPYGERDVIVDDTLGDIITPTEAGLIYRGAEESDQEAILQRVPFNLRRYPAEKVARAIERHPNNDALEALLRQSYEKQRRYAALEREKVLENDHEYVRSLGAAALTLNSEYFLNYIDEDELMSRLFGPDGQPAFQYVPLTFVAYRRLLMLTGKFDLKVGADIPPYTDFAYGIISAPMGLAARSLEFASDTRPHEWVHAGIAGVELYDITNDVGEREPYSTSNASLMFEPTTEVGSDINDDYGDEGIAEGWVDTISKELMEVDPTLGQPFAGGYDHWVDKMRVIFNHFPAVYGAIARASLLEADPSNPDAKHEAVERMHEIADKESGKKGSLEYYFTE